jgi:hypothetical protein
LAAAVDDDHPLGHAGENRPGERAVVRALRQPGAQVPHGLVQDTRDGPDLVVPVVGRRA